jgi:hypothetical protein
MQLSIVAAPPGNLSSAVRKILRGQQRELTVRFADLPVGSIAELLPWNLAVAKT